MRKLLVLGLVLVSVYEARAQVAYSNTNPGTIAGGFLHGGSANIGGNTITTLLADDITPGAGLGGKWVTDFTFSVGNADVAAQTVRARIRFWADDGAFGSPGTFLAGFDSAPITNLGGFGQFVTISGLLPGQFLLPTGRFWAGVAFDDSNGTLGSAAAMNQQGEFLDNPPTVGTSADLAFITGVPGDFFGVNNPGGFQFNLGGAPVANFVWEFVVAPEPTSCLLFAGLAVVGLGSVRKRLRLGSKSAV